MAVCLTLWGISSRFPLTRHGALPGSESDWFISGSSQMCAALIAKMDSHEEAYGQGDSTHYEVVPCPFFTSKEPSCSCAVREVFMTLRIRTMWSFNSYWDRGSALLPPALLEYLSMGEKPQLLSWGSFISCLSSNKVWMCKAVPRPASTSLTLHPKRLTNCPFSAL